MDKKRKGTGSLVYSLGMVSYNVEYLVVGQLTFALTESYAMSAITVGMIFMVSRFLDGFTDILAGFIIDRFNPKVGKARLYDILHLPLWICLVLVFSVPDIGYTGKIIWVFIFYNLLQSVTATFMNVAEPLRLQRSIEEQNRLRVVSIYSIASLVVGMGAGILMPILISLYGQQPHGWTIISLIFAVPMVVCGLARFIFLPELPQAQSAAMQKPPSLKVMVKSLFQNKYALLFGGVMICWAMFNTMSQSGVSYYFTYIYGDISKASILSLLALTTVVYLALVPKLIHRFGKVNVLRTALALAMVCCLGRLLMPTNLIWLALMYIGSTIGLMTLSFMKALLNIDCITYGKWKTGNNVEAVYSTVNSLADKFGLGIGSVLLGLVLQIGGYDGTLAAQPASALTTIKLLYTAIPASLMAIALIFLAFFNLDKRLPAIQKDLQARQATDANP